MNYMNKEIEELQAEVEGSIIFLNKDNKYNYKEICIMWQEEDMKIEGQIA